MGSIAADLVITQRARYERLWGALTRRQRALVTSVLDDLERELARSRRGSWSEAMAVSQLLQIATVVKTLNAKQVAMLNRALPAIARRAQLDLAEYLLTLDSTFLGVGRPMRWDAVEWLQGYTRPLMRSRLRIYKASFARYGAEAVSAVEDAVAKTVLVGTPWTEARAAVTAAVKQQVGDRQWMVDRIIRTEVSTVYNATTMAALLEEDTPQDPMLKKLVAVWDMVTGTDSKLLHGQTRRVTELFTDVVSGREFDHPPNRPHDREIVVGWRASWGNQAGFDADTRNHDGLPSSG